MQGTIGKTFRFLHEMSGPAKIVFRFCIPFVLAAIFILTLYLLLDHDTFIVLTGFMAVYFVPPAGKESVIPIAIASGLIPWWLIAPVLAVIDILCALFMVLNFDLALKIPFFGTKLMKTIVDNGSSFFEKHPWIKGFSSVGLTIFVIIPLQGTGGLTTPIIGKMIGMPGKNIMLAVIVGSLISCYSIALGSEYVYQLFITDMWVGILAIVLIAAAVIGGWYLWKHFKERIGNRYYPELMKQDVNGEHGDESGAQDISAESKPAESDVTGGNAADSGASGNDASGSDDAIHNDISER